MIHLTWIDPQQTVLCLNYEPPVADWDEYLEANQRAYAMMREKSHVVHLIHHAGDVACDGHQPSLLARGG